MGLESACFALCCSYCARGLNLICHAVKRRRKLKEENTFSLLALVAVSIQFVSVVKKQFRRPLFIEVLALLVFYAACIGSYDVSGHLDT